MRRASIVLCAILTTIWLMSGGYPGQDSNVESGSNASSETTSGRAGSGNNPTGLPASTKPDAEQPLKTPTPRKSLEATPTQQSNLHKTTNGKNSLAAEKSEIRTWADVLKSITTSFFPWPIIAIALLLYIF